MIDIAISLDRNIIQKESEKKLYKNLTMKIDFQRIWNTKCFVLLVIMGTSGIVTKGLKKYMETIPGKHSADSVQKQSHLSLSDGV
jgi:hypothetical protein